MRRSGDGAGAGAAEQFPRFRRRDRTGIEIALDSVAAERLDKAPLLGGRNPFGHRLHAEAAGEGYDGADDGEALRVPLGNGMDEAAVDLERVERRLAQIAERRIAGAEIVHGEADAEA